MDKDVWAVYIYPLAEAAERVYIYILVHSSYGVCAFREIYVRKVHILSEAPFLVNLLNSAEEGKLE